MVIRIESTRRVESAGVSDSVNSKKAAAETAFLLANDQY